MMPSPPPLSNLSALLKPSLFSKVLEKRMTWPKSSTLDFNLVGQAIFFAEEPNPYEFNDLVFPTLKALSSLGVSNLPSLNLLQFLPPPTSPDFPPQALGLQLLLDIGSRSLCRGMDERYTAGYFDIISRNLALTYLSLPRELQPQSKSRWIGELGASVDYWMVCRIWFITPLIHSDDIAHHSIAYSETENLRCEVETISGTRDPYRARKGELDNDIYSFFNMMVQKPPQGEDVKMEDFMFWFCTVIDAHKPIVEHFGRYPYHNVALGRVSSEEEKVWLERTGGWGNADQEVAERIREDFEAGRWRPFGEGYEFGEGV
jgi:uncharacterized protein (DUF924 family)